MKKHNLVEVNTNFNYEKIPFGIYLNDNKFKELNKKQVESWNICGKIKEICWREHNGRTG